MKKFVKKAMVVLAIIFALTLLMSFTVGAEEATSASATEAVEKADGAIGLNAIAAAVAIGIAAFAGAISMGMSISKATESISRQPEAAGSIRTTLMLGLVFIETAIIYALIIAILIIFVL